MIQANFRKHQTEQHQHRRVAMIAAAQVIQTRYREYLGPNKTQTQSVLRETALPITQAPFSPTWAEVSQKFLCALLKKRETRVHE